MPTKNRVTLLEASRIGALNTHVHAPLLPHERDESTAASAAPQAVMIQAQRDVARGLEETDCYTRLGKLVARPGKK